MEPQFVNHVTLDKKNIAVLVRATFNRVASVLCIVAVVLFAAFGVTELILQRGWPVVIVAAAACVFFIFYPFILRGVLTRRFWETQRLMNGGKDAQRFTEFSDRIRVLSSNKGETLFDYKQVTRFFDTEHLFILRIGKRVAVVVAKDGFTTGTFGEFVDFIRAKCPSVRFIYR